MPRVRRTAAACPRERLGLVCLAGFLFLVLAAFLQRADRRSRAVRQRRATVGRFFFDAGVDPCAGGDEPLSPEDGSPLDPGAMTVPGRPCCSCPVWDVGGGPVTSTTVSTVPS